MILNRLKRLLRYALSDQRARSRLRAGRDWKQRDGDRTLRLQYPIEQKSVVVDVGGYHGQWASDIYAMYRCKVHVFEPIPEFAEEIRKRFASNENITLHQVALGTRDERVVFAQAEDSSGRLATSSEHQAHPHITVRDASYYLREKGITSIDLMKVNIEGDEYDLLRNLAAGNLIEHIRNLQIQFHSHVPDADQRLAEAHKLLSLTHRPTWQFLYCWENWELIK